MGTTIESIGVSGGAWRHRTSALAHADTAVRRCLDAADIGPSEVDLLVNAGLYRDRNLGEPALAALIQDDVHLNAEDPHLGTHGTFSFDITNGSCGALSALHIVDGFLRARTIDRAVVVTSDASPGHRLTRDFPFAPAGAAALCGWRPGHVGLGAFRWLSRPDDGDSFRSTIRFEDGHNVLRFEIDGDFPSRAGAAAAKAADEVMSEAGLTPSLLDLAVVAPGDPAFVDAFSATTGIRPDNIVAADPLVHTAGFLGALRVALDTERLPPGSTVLFAAAAAGITAGAVLYQT